MYQTPICMPTGLLVSHHVLSSLMCNFTVLCGISIKEQDVIWELRVFQMLSQKSLAVLLLCHGDQDSKNQTQLRVSSPYCTFLFIKQTLRMPLPAFQRPFPQLISPDVFSKPLFPTCLLWHHSYTWESAPQYVGQSKIHIGFYNTHLFLVKLGTILGSH